MASFALPQHGIEHELAGGNFQFQKRPRGKGFDFATRARLFSLLEVRNRRFSDRILRHLSLPSLSRHRNLLRTAGRLSRWHRQRHNPLQHAAKQPPRQMALRQQKPVVTRVLDQSSAGRTNPAIRVPDDMQLVLQ
jgi:hypothetical protein